MARLKRRRVHVLQHPLQPPVPQKKIAAQDQSGREDIAKAFARTRSHRRFQHLNQQTLFPDNLLMRYGGLIGNLAVRRLLFRQDSDIGVSEPSIAAQIVPGQVHGVPVPPAGVLDQPVADKPAGMAPPETRRMVRQGSSGPEVAYAQERLNAHGAMPPLAVDAIFGPLTRKAAVEYQKSHGLVPDAIIGPRTWASLDGPAQLGG
jgi:hypothetical protein